MIAAKMNDKKWEFNSYRLKNLHPMFTNKLKTKYDECMPFDVTPTQVKASMADLKTKVMHIVKNFEKSGNGDGNLIDSEKINGSIVV